MVPYPNQMFSDFTEADNLNWQEIIFFYSQRHLNTYKNTPPATKSDPWRHVSGGDKLLTQKQQEMLR